MHGLLRRQLARLLGGDDPPADWKPLLEMVEAAYGHFEDDRDLLERSLELSSTELMQKNSELRAVFRAFPDSFFWLDDQGRVLDYRGGRKSRYNYPPHTVVGKTIFEIPICRREDLLRPALERAVSTGEPTELEYAVPLDGEEQYYEARLLPLFDDRFIAIVRNITHRKKAEEALRRARNEMERRVRERTAELTDANRVLEAEIHRRILAQEQLLVAKLAAEQANLTKTSFLSMVSHELRTPLTSVVGFAKMIRKKLGETVLPAITPGNERVDRAADQVMGNTGIIIAEGERLTALINDVLDISKLEAGKVNFNLQPLRVEQLMDHAAASVRALFEDKGLGYAQDIPPDLPLVKGDRDRLIQVLINLLSNAVKFTDSGGVTCRASAMEGFVRLSVEDTGRGIRPQDQERIFSKFQQLGDTLTDRPEGSGLGLAICRQIVEHHGGTITVQSDPGHGSTFCFTVPLVRSESLG